VHVHPEDQDLVSEADKRWWGGLTLKDCHIMEHEDNTWQAVASSYQIDDVGLSEKTRHVECASLPPLLCYLCGKDGRTSRS
jgi:hypothetical protein